MFFPLSFHLFFPFLFPPLLLPSPPTPHFLLPYFPSPFHVLLLPFPSSQVSISYLLPLYLLPSSPSSCHLFPSIISVFPLFSPIFFLVFPSSCHPFPFRLLLSFSFSIPSLSYSFSPLPSHWFFLPSLISQLAPHDSFTLLPLLIFFC